MTFDLPTGHERRYLLHGVVAHVIDMDRVRGYLSEGLALCGMGPQWFEPHGWRGTGTQDEYERAASLPLCRRCIGRLQARLADHGWRQ